jgi:hypothetical protein
MEVSGGEKIQVGFTLTLYATLPRDSPVGKQRNEDFLRRREELRAFLEETVPVDPSLVRTELEPLRSAAVLRPENELRPELAVTWRIFHADQYLKPVTQEERQRLGQVEKQLSGLGLRQGHW